MTIFVNKVLSLTVSDVALRIINKRSYIFHILRFFIQMGIYLESLYQHIILIYVLLLSRFSRVQLCATP